MGSSSTPNSPSGSPRSSTSREWDVEEHGHPLEFLVSGYDDDGIGDLREVLIPGPRFVEIEADTTNLGSVWRGQTDVISRLLKGVDWPQLLISLDELPDELEEVLDGLQYKTLYPITVQDGLDYSSFLIQTTIDMQRFSDGTVERPGLVPGCGGPIQRLVITPDGTSWANEGGRGAGHLPRH